MKERLLKLRAVLLLAILSVVGLSAYAGDDFYAKVTATATPTGAGKVYVYPDVKNGPDLNSIPASSFIDTDEHTFEFSVGEESASISSGEVWIYAKPEQGCTFEGWALASNPNEIISTDAKFSPAFEVHSQDEENPDIINYIAKFSGQVRAPFISGATMICGEDEFTLSTQSMVSVEQAEAIAASVSSDVRKVTYTIYNMAQEEGEESKWVPTTTIASGEMSINGTAYAEFDEPITFAEGSRYMVTIKACDMDENEESVSYTIMGAYSAPQPEITPSFLDGENEVTLSGSEVSVESASAIKVGFGEGANAVKYANYSINEYVEDEIMGVTHTEKVEIASGNLNINGFGYAEFEEPLVFNEGTKYNIEIKAWDTEDLYNPDFSIKDPVATFTCDFNGAYTSASSELVNADFAQGVLGDINVATYERDGTPNHMQEVPGWSFGVNNIDARAGGVVAYGSGTTFGGPSYGVPAEGPEGTNGKALAVLAVWTGTVQYVQNVTLPAGKYKMTVPVFNTAGTTNFVKNLIGVKYGETEKYATALSYPVSAWTVEAVEFELTEETEVTVSLGYEGANCGAGAAQHLYYDCVKIGASVAPEVTLIGADENEYALNDHSTVTFDQPISGIKVAGLDQEKDYNYNISEGSTTLAEGQLSVNVIGYAEFAPLSLYEGHTYTLTLTTGSETVATYTLIGAMEEEQNDLDFTDKVVKEVKANTSNIEEGKWYAWSNPRNVNSTYGAPTPFYDQGEGKKPKREAFGQTVRTVLSQNTPVSDVTKYLVRFVKSGTGEAYHIQFATGNYIKNDLTATATAEEAGLFMVYAATNSKADAAGELYTEAGVGINITEDGVAYGSRLDGNGAGAELVTWGNSKIETPDANNVWFFEEVEMAEPTTETYTVHITGAPSETKVTFGEQEYGNDDTFDAKGFSLSQLTVPDHENYVKSVELNGTDIYVTYTYAKKVADLSEINNEHAYVLICERGQLTTNEGELAPTAEKSYTESKSVFAFVQYNENFYLWSVAEEGFVFGDKSIAAEGEFQNVVLNAQEDGTFVLYLADTDHYINIDGATTLLIDDWDTADAGNKYSIYEVETFDATDALTLLENFTTGINAVAAPAAPAAIYSLTGQRQQRLQKGINIVRRQKVIK